MAKEKIELSLQDESGQECVAYPFVESTDVSLSNGMDIETMIAQDVSLPTIVHSETSFKAGVGDSDVSNSIVDSSVANMTIKGQTYQNILPEPSTHVLSNNKEMFKVNEGLDPNVEIIDGVSKSAILSGQTLVNLSQFHLLYNVEPSSITTTGVSWYQQLSSQYVNNYFKPNTKYIVKFGKNTPSRLSRIYMTGLWSDGWKGHNSIIQTKDTLAESSNYQMEWVDGEQLTKEEWCKAEIMILEYQEGMENWDIPYFEGMQSVKMPVLTTIGKNMCNPYDFIGGTIDGNTITIGASTLFNVKLYYSFEENTQYTFSLNSESINSKIVYLRFDYTDGNTSAYKHILPTNGNRASFTSEANKTLLRISFIYSSVDTYILSNIQLEKGSKATPYEPYKSNILTVNEDVTLRGIGNVKDTLDCLTGEVTERIGEIVLDGSGYITFTNPFNGVYEYALNGNVANMIITIPKTSSTNYTNPSYNGYYYLIGNKIRIIQHDCASADDFKQWLQQNPITVQYELAEPIVKTVDLSSSGNWEKVVLNGSEDESWEDGDNGLSKTHRFYVRIPNSLSGNHRPITDSTYFTAIEAGTSSQDTPCVQVASNKIYFRIERQIANDLTSFKTWLQSNPITIWYPTATHQDSTQVKQPIFFKDGHIQLSSGADNSLIPTLDYQAKTSNSYVMDLMKTNTKYTMKAKSASGTFTIDGTSYGAGTNGTFTSPTSMTNKLLVMSNKTNEEVMILEGDVTSKVIPYFKGIKSAFEDESKIEVLSTGKNLFDRDDFVKRVLALSTTHSLNGNILRYATGITHNQRLIDGIFKKNTQYTIKYFVTMEEASKNFAIVFKYTDGTTSLNSLGNNAIDTYELTLTSDANKTVDYFYTSFGYATTVSVDLSKIQLEESSTPTPYEPHKSNITKIPLLSPLRKLPNGVYDEVILDRENNKAKIIQRVGKAVLNGSENWVLYGDAEGYYAMQTRLTNCKGAWSTCYSLCDKLRYNEGSVYYKSGKAYTLGAENDIPNAIYVCLPKSELTSPDAKGFKQWMRDNTPVVTYRLATPIITEVDLEGFPYIYKDGHIFLNGEIAPVTEIKYSINQSHMIEASNQDLIRHQKEIDYLYKLIGEYVRVDYKNTLLSLNLELK